MLYYNSPLLRALVPQCLRVTKQTGRHQNGNSFLISSTVGLRPYSQISNASAYFTALPFSSPYHCANAARYFCASLDCRPLHLSLSHARRPASSLAGGTPRTNSSLPLAPPS